MRDDTTKKWFGAKCVFEHLDLMPINGKRSVFEERIIVLKAVSFEDAVEIAENEARSYCEDLEGTEYLEYINVFEIYEKDIINMTEVYSLMRSSDLDKEDYLDSIIDTGYEHDSSIR